MEAISFKYRMTKCNEIMFISLKHRCMAYDQFKKIFECTLSGNFCENEMTHITLQLPASIFLSVSLRKSAAGYCFNNFKVDIVRIKRNRNQNCFRNSPTLTFRLRSFRSSWSFFQCTTHISVLTSGILIILKKSLLSP